MRYLIITAYLLLTSSSIAICQLDYSNFKDSDSEATQILDKLYNYISDAPDYTVQFSLELELPGEQPQLEHGELSQSGNNYLLKLQSQAIYTYEDTRWTHLIEQNEVLIDNHVNESSDENLNMTPLGLLKLYKSKDIVYAILNTEPFESSTRYYIEFKPLDDYSDYSKMRIDIVDNDVPNLEKITIFNKDASKYNILVQDMKINNGLNASYFTFDKSNFPNIHVEDIRL